MKKVLYDLNEQSIPRIDYVVRASHLIAPSRGPLETVRHDVTGCFNGSSNETDVDIS